MISTRTKTEITQLIQGPVGKLEVVCSIADEEKKSAWGIVCHPHPLYSGTMNNKVVTTLTKAFQGIGLNTVRFNFRGVGQSEGQYDNGRGELDDLLAVMTWIGCAARHSPEIWLAGFSFGAYIAAQAATQIALKKLVLVAPPVENFPMQSLPPFLCPWILVQGDQDEVVPPAAVYTWAESRTPVPKILRFPQATHFFHGQQTELRSRVEKALTVS